MDLEEYELVILRRPAQPSSYDDETMGQLQAEHLAYLDRLRDDGMVVVNGPLVDQPDESMRGLTFFCTGSLEETRRLAEQDPLFVAGRLEVEVMRWWCRPGLMVRPGRPLTDDD
jgi:uncharacterized protein